MSAPSHAADGRSLRDPVPARRETVGAAHADGPGRTATFALWFLMLGAFAIGAGEFVVMGLLNEVAADLGVTIPAAGWLVTGYALGVAIGGPLVAIATLRVPRRPLLIGLMGVFALGTALCAWGPSYGVLMAGRVLGAVAHGAFVGAAAVVATRLVPPERAGSAVATVIGGFTVATVVGVPLGTWLGQALGWRAVFWAILAVVVLAGIGMAVLLPRDAANDEASGGGPDDAPDLRRELCAVVRPSVLMAFAITALAFGGLFAAYTYVAPFLTEVAGFDAALVAPMLFLFGIGALVGNAIGGRLANRDALRAIIIMVGTLTVALALLPFASGSQVAVGVVLFAIGAAAFGATPGFQLRVVSEARDAPFLASTLNITAFNLGNALGAFLGGVAVAGSLGVVGTGWVGAALAAGGVLVAVLSRRMDRRAVAGVGR